MVNSGEIKNTRVYAMTRSRTELMVDRLREMQAASPDIEASAESLTGVVGR
jgi:hypothetical protein